MHTYIHICIDTYLESILLEVIEDADVFICDEGDVHKHVFIHSYIQMHIYMHICIDTYLESILLEVIEDADAFICDEGDVHKHVLIHSYIQIHTYIYMYRYIPRINFIRGH
jgi:chloramphenicol 3-O-phosphotransferase